MPPAEAASPSERGRAAHARREWLSAYEALSEADRSAPLQPADLELLATAASLLGRDDECVAAFERAHHAHLAAGAMLPAARCAFWIGLHLLLEGSEAPAGGWLARCRRLVDAEGGECVEQGYLLVPEMVGQEAAGDYADAVATAIAAAGFGERFGDADLIALARHEQGRALTKLGQREAGFALLDETMVAVTAGELSPFITGLIYCSVIEGCHQVYELRRAQEWTQALTRWCDDQPDLVSFTGRCLVHRAEILQLRGAWPDALEEAQRAGERFALATRGAAAGEAAYRQGEIHRLRGEYAPAAEAFQAASRCGWEPQPGLALLRLAQGDGAAAASAIRRAWGRPAIACGAPLCSRRPWRSCSRWATSRRRAARATSSPGSAPPTAVACWPRLRLMPTARWRSRTAMRGPRSRRCARPAACGWSSASRTRRRGCARSSDGPAARSRTRMRRASSWTRRARSSSSSAPALPSPVWMRSSRRAVRRCPRALPA